MKRRAGTTDSEVAPVVDIKEGYKIARLSMRDEIIRNWREKQAGYEDLFWLAMLDSEAACLVEQALDKDNWSAEQFAKLVQRSSLNPDCSTYYRAIGATLRWVKRDLRTRTYDIHKFLGPLLFRRENLLQSERDDLMELAVRYMPENIWGNRLAQVTLDAFVVGHMIDAIAAFKNFLLRDESDQPITMHQALQLGLNKPRLMVLLQLLAMAAEDKRAQSRQPVEEVA